MTFPQFEYYGQNYLIYLRAYLFTYSQYFFFIGNCSFIYSLLVVRYLTLIYAIYNFY